MSSLGGVLGQTPTVSGRRGGSAGSPWSIGAVSVGAAGGGDGFGAGPRGAVLPRRLRFAVPVRAQVVVSVPRSVGLFLTQLVADELAAGRLVRRSGVWLWDGSPAVSPKLSELVDAMIGRQPESVAAVLEVLAVADPLPTPVLVGLVDSDAIDVAEARGLITAWR